MFYLRHSSDRCSICGVCSKKMRCACSSLNVTHCASSRATSQLKIFDMPSFSPQMPDLYQSEQHNNAVQRQSDSSSTAQCLPRASRSLLRPASSRSTVQWQPQALRRIARFRQKAQTMFLVLIRGAHSQSCGIVCQLLSSAPGTSCT